ncbi:MAG TPA: hypothetical protein VFL91_21215 [Thermomicrobiales bacterium]|nr:hypothetical protein [Thermomicrobiales bacterium]
MSARTEFLAGDVVRTPGEREPLGTVLYETGPGETILVRLFEPLVRHSARGVVVTEVVKRERGQLAVVNGTAVRRPDGAPRDDRRARMWRELHGAPPVSAAQEFAEDLAELLSLAGID